MKPSIPQGTRDFSALTIFKRNYIFNTIRSVFELYGFQPLETPAMENLETLMGKYGDEGDKLIFKVLNNGLDNPAKHLQAKQDFDKVLEGKNVKSITERALRYDLTIPFARYIAMNIGQLTLPFKRYQIQPVWRADRPQRGRYREFYQCDADVVGSNSLMNEVDLTNIYDRVFTQLGIQVEIRINSRKILAALAELCGDVSKMTDITVAIDKLDKIGLQKVKEELLGKGLTTIQIETIEKYLSISGSAKDKMQQLNTLLANSETGKKGISEIEFVLNYCSDSHMSIVPDFTLARGLNYYTGIIFEVTAVDVQIGSIGGGGRYDDLTGLFGVPNIPGVGISFGVDRIYDVMEELQIFPAELSYSTKVLFFNMGEQESRKSYELMQQIRKQGISAELYHENIRLEKQFKYAEKKSIQFVVILGSNEMNAKVCIVKNILSGEQHTMEWATFSEKIDSILRN